MIVECDGDVTATEATKADGGALGTGLVTNEHLAVFDEPGLKERDRWVPFGILRRACGRSDILAHDRSRNFILNCVNPLAIALYFLRDCLSRNGHISILQVRHLSMVSV